MNDLDKLFGEIAEDEIDLVPWEIATALEEGGDLEAYNIYSDVWDQAWQRWDKRSPSTTFLDCLVMLADEALRR